ncbi:MAG: hypothetical protein ACRC8Y_26615 [Chroococcales cyanobacterium]
MLSYLSRKWLKYLGVKQAIALNRDLETLGIGLEAIAQGVVVHPALTATSGAG